MELIDNGVVIQIPEHPDDTKGFYNQHATILKRMNGFNTYQKNISMMSLVDAVLTVMEPYDVVLQLFRIHQTLDEEFLAAVLEYAQVPQLNQVGLTLFKTLIHLIDQGERADLVRLFYEVFNNRYEYTSFSKDNLLHMSILKNAINFIDLKAVASSDIEVLVTKLTNNVQELKDPTDMYNLFQVVFTKMDLLSCNREIIKDLLQRLGRRAVQNNDGQIKKWFAEILQSMVEGNKVYDTPILPQGTLYYRKNDNGIEVVSIEVAKGNHDIIYHQTPIKAVGHPKLIFSFSMRNNKILQCKIVAIKDEYFTQKSKIYRYPFGNVFSSSNACWAEIKDMEIKDLHDLHGLVRLFFASPTNDHSYERENLRERYLSLQGMPFNDDELIEYPSTFDELIMS